MSHRAARFAAVLLGGAAVIAVALAIGRRDRVPAVPGHSAPTDSEEPWTGNGEVGGAAASAPGGSRAAVLADEVDAAVKGDWIHGVVVGRMGFDPRTAECSLTSRLPDSGYGGRLPPRSAANTAPVATTRCSADGTFALPAPPGEWTLRVIAPGHRPWREDGLCAGDFRWVVLDEGVEVTVYVADEDGAPVAGASARLQHDEFEPASAASAASVTDAMGTARLLAEPGIWTLVVEHDDHITERGRLRFTEGVPHPGVSVVLFRGVGVRGRVRDADGGLPPDGTSVRIESPVDRRLPERIAVDRDGRFSLGTRLSPGQSLEIAALAPDRAETRIEFAIPHERGAMGEVELVLGALGRSARGRAVDTGGAPVVGARIWLVPLVELPPAEVSYVESDATLGLEIAPKRSLTSRRRAAGTTDEDGRFRVDGLDPSRAYSVLLTADGCANAELWIESGVAGVEVELGDAVLEAGGRVFGVVRTRGGAPIHGIEVSAVSFEREEFRPGRTKVVRRPTQERTAFDAFTGAQGNFSIAQLPAGMYLLLVGGEPSEPVTVTAGGSSGPHEIELDRDPRDDAASRLVEGLVVDAAGRPLGDVQLHFVAIAGADRVWAGVKTFTKSDGCFSLAVRDEGALHVEAIPLRGDAASATLVLEEGKERLDLVLAPPARAPSRLTGSVRSASGAPLAGAKVEVTVTPLVTGCDCVRFGALADGAGAFDLGPLIDGAHRLVVTDPAGGHGPAVVFPARPGEPVEVWMEE